MDSRDSSRIYKHIDKTIGPLRNFAELDSELSIESTTSSTTFESIDSSSLTHASHDDRNHVKGCSSKYGNTCTCEVLTRYKRAQERRIEYKTRSHHELPTNDTMNSTILAGNFKITSGGTSRASSDSFHSAQSATDDIQVVYQRTQLQSTAASSECTSESLNIACSESKIMDTNHNIGSNPESDSEAEGQSESGVPADETSYIMPFLERLCKEIGISSSGIKDKHSNIIKRLSMSFAKNPVAVNERLLTIIEETDLNCYQQNDDRDFENLSRLTIDFRKACKYIMDESMPSHIFAQSVDPSRSFLPNTSRSPLTSATSNPLPKRKSSVEFQTPVQDDHGRMKRVYRKTPKNVDNVQKSNQSPLCIAMLKRANATPKTPPITPKNVTPVTDKSHERNGALKGSSGSPRTPLRTPKNIPYEDSFLFWEDYAHKHATPVSDSKKRSQLRRSKSVSDVAVQIQAERNKRTGELQYHCLDDSPLTTSTYLVRKKSVENELYDTFDSHANNHEDLAESILEEVMKKRLRCVETEKTIREIDAASTSADDSAEANVLEYLHSVVGRYSEYHQCLVKNRDAIEKTVKTIVEKHTPKSKAPAKTPVRTVNSTKKSQTVMSELRRSAFVVNLRRISPVDTATTPRVTPASRPNRGEASLYLRGLGAKKTTLSSKSSAVRRATPSRINNRPLTLTRSTPNLALLAKPVESKSRPVSGGLTPSRVLSASKTPAKLSVVRTPAKVNGIDDFRANSVTLRSKFPRTPKAVLTKSKSVQNVPLLCRTPATPVSRATAASRDTKSQNPDKLLTVTSRHTQTPAKGSEKPAITCRAGKFFNTPVRPDLKASKFFQTPITPQVSSVFLKRGKFFETPKPQERKKEGSVVSQAKSGFAGRAVYYGYENVKSPVAEYINSTDAKLVQNIRSKDNAYLLTPKAKQTATSRETLRVKLGGVKQIARNSRQTENDENVLDAPMDSFPKVMYQPPAAVYDINCSPSSKVRGGNGKVLREINNRRVVVRHEGRIQDDLAEQSIHISKPAEKSNYVGYSQPARKPFK